MKAQSPKLIQDMNMQQYVRVKFTFIVNQSCYLPQYLWFCLWLLWQGGGPSYFHVIPIKALEIFVGEDKGPLLPPAEDEVPLVSHDPDHDGGRGGGRRPQCAQLATEGVAAGVGEGKVFSVILKMQ